MSRASFKSVLRRDLKVSRAGRLTEVRDPASGLKYRVDRANAQTAALLNSKFPAAVVAPHFQ